MASFLPRSLALVCLIALSLHADSPRANEPAPDLPRLARPNILFIVADDLATRLGCYGDRAAITPNLDRLAQEGLLFHRAYCQGVVCTPSRTSFMLGLNNQHAKPTHFIQNPDTITLGRWMRTHGYQTCSIGKLDHDDPKDSYVDPKAWDVRVKREDIVLPVKPNHLTPIHEDLGLRRQNISRMGIQDSPQATTDGIRTERALHFLKSERDPKKPFFLGVGFHTPHVPWDTTKECFDQHQKTKFTL